MKRVHLILFVFIVIVAAWCTMSIGEEKTSEDYAALFPSPPAGWEVSAVTVDVKEKLVSFEELNVLFGEEVPQRLFLTRTYSSQKDGGKVTIQLDTEDLVKSTYIKTVQTASPDELKSLEKDGFYQFHYQGYDGIKMLDDAKNTVWIGLEISPAAIFEIDVNTFGKNKGIVMDFLEKTDLQKIDAFMKKH